MSNLINKYSEMTNFLHRLIVTTDDLELKEFAKQSLINFINGMYKIEKNNRNLYEDLLEKYGLEKNNLIIVNNNLEYIENDKFSSYKKELENIFKNPNEESIKVWLKELLKKLN